MTWVLLLSLLIKSSVVAGAGLACARFLAQRSVDRVDILRGAVCLLLALPVIMNVLPAMDLAVLPPLSPVAPPTGMAEAAAAGEASSGALTWPPPALLVGGLWLLGVVAIAGQLQLGLLTLHRWTREGSPVTCIDWLAPLEHLPPGDRPNLVSSERVASPLSWGVAPGFVVIDPASLIERHAAPAILAHELAHLRRHDWIFLVLSRLALALFWFNPLVWRLHAVLAERSEEAADAAALETVDRTVYAKTLVRLAAYPIPRAATAMAADARTLKTRIACIMTNTSARRRPLTVALTVAALAVVATPMAALGLSHQAWVEPPPPPAPPVAHVRRRPSAAPRAAGTDGRRLACRSGRSGSAGASGGSGRARRWCRLQLLPDRHARREASRRRGPRPRRGRSHPGRRGQAPRRREPRSGRRGQTSRR
jgi:beta-lactamase regulating signal transducer with metallopeptidase domain